MADLDPPGRDLLKRQDRAARATLRDAVERHAAQLADRVRTANGKGVGWISTVPPRCES